MAYTEITFKVNTNHAIRLRDGICGHFGYEDVDPLTGEDNTESKQDFALRMIRESVKNWVRKYERQQAINNLDIEEIEVTE